LIEIDSHCGLQIVIAVIRMGAARLLRVGMNVDRDEFFDVHGKLLRAAFAFGPRDLGLVVHHTQSGGGQRC
jgi:hypothetical protein